MHQLIAFLFFCILQLSIWRPSAFIELILVLLVPGRKPLNFESHLFIWKTLFLGAITSNKPRENLQQKDLVFPIWHFRGQDYSSSWPIFLTDDNFLISFEWVYTSDTLS